MIERKYSSLRFSSAVRSSTRRSSSAYAFCSSASAIFRSCTLRTVARTRSWPLIMIRRRLTSTQVMRPLLCRICHSNSCGSPAAAARRYAKAAASSNGGCPVPSSDGPTARNSATV